MSNSRLHPQSGGHIWNHISNLVLYLETAIYDFQWQKLSHLWTNGRPWQFLYSHMSISESNTQLGLFPMPPLRCVQCCPSGSKQPLVHHRLWTDGHMGQSFELDTQKTRTDWFWTNQLQIIFPLGKHKRTHFPVEWATIQRAIFRSHILPESTAPLSVCVWGVGATSITHNPCVWCGIMTHVLPAFDPEFWSQVDTWLLPFVQDRGQQMQFHKQNCWTKKQHRAELV